MKKLKKIMAFMVIVSSLTLLMGATAFAQTKQPRNKDLCYVNTDGGNLNCRSGPGEDNAIVGKFKNGTQLNWSIFAMTDSQGREWTGVSGKDINGKIIDGWVLDSYLRYVPQGRSSNQNVIVNPNMPDVG